MNQFNKINGSALDALEAIEKTETCQKQVRKTMPIIQASIICPVIETGKCTYVLKTPGETIRAQVSTEQYTGSVDLTGPKMGANGKLILPVAKPVKGTGTKGQRQKGKGKDLVVPSFGLLFPHGSQPLNPFNHGLTAGEHKAATAYLEKNYWLIPVRHLKGLDCRTAVAAVLCGEPCSTGEVRIDSLTNINEFHRGEAHDLGYRNQWLPRQRRRSNNLRGGVANV